jgi:cellulose synthase/poly-beta-1,6-N-acetylglucosamine synthase-like glycosyltransferase
MEQGSIPVTLALTTLNEGHTIAAFLASVAAQSALPEQISICDGGSRDNTVRLIAGTSIPGAEITLVEEPGSNIARGRNAAIRNARHEVVAVSDAGSILPPDWLEKITKPLLEDESADAVGGGYGFEASTRFERIAAAAEMDVDDIPADSFLPSSRSFAFRKSVWEEAGGYPERLTFAGEDTAFCLELKRRGRRILLRRDARVYWRPRPTLRAYVKQHYLYGVGDGEAGSHARAHAKAAAKHLAFTIILIAGFLHPLFFAAFILAVTLYHLRLRPLYRWRKQPVSVWCPAFVLIFVKEASCLAGYCAGSSRRNRVRNTA